MDSCYWKGQPLESLTKEELIEAVKTLDKLLRDARKSKEQVLETMYAFNRKYG